MKTKISIITPTFNSEKTLERTANSIFRQSFKDWDYLLIDNCSTDGTRDLAMRFSEKRAQKVQFFSEQDKGISDAFNKGIQRSQNEIIGILNSDDEYYDEQVLEKVSRTFLDPSVDFVHGDMLFVDERHGSNVRAPLLCPLSYAMPYNHPTMFFRKSVYNQIGLFDLEYRYAMDFELICRMYSDLRKCKFKGEYLKGAPLVKMYAGGISWNQELKSIDEVERALKKYGFWSSEAEQNQKRRRFRIKLKDQMSKLKMDSIIKLWRKWKWS